MGIYTDVYSAHLHVRGVLADLCRRAIYEPALRPPLSTPILIIINDRRHFPTATRGHARLFRGDAPRRGHDVCTYIYVQRRIGKNARGWASYAPVGISRRLSPIIETRNRLRIGAHTLKAYVVAEAARIFIIVGRPLSIYPLPVIIAPDFVTSNGVC